MYSNADNDGDQFEKPGQNKIAPRKKKEKAFRFQNPEIQ